MGDAFAGLLVLAGQGVYWGILGLGAWCAISNRKRWLVISLVVTWYLATWVISVLALSAMHGSLPVYVVLIFWVFGAASLALFIFLIRLAYRPKPARETA